MTINKNNIKLVLLRHGQSEWNLSKRFTGWTDIDLTEKGIEEAKNAAAILKENNYTFDIAFTSVLIRAIHTLKIVLESLNITDIPIIQSWRLNERHYGDLQGRHKDEIAQRFGKEQVHLWRRSFSTRPPALEKSDPRFPGNDPKYSDVDPKLLPTTESLKDTVDRLLPLWHKQIAPELKNGKKVLISAHGNSLRALIAYFEFPHITDLPKIEIPTGIPLIYELNDKLQPIKKYYLEYKKHTERRKK